MVTVGCRVVVLVFMGGGGGEVGVSVVCGLELLVELGVGEVAAAVLGLVVELSAVASPLKT